jgi:hypothetical protein
METIENIEGYFKARCSYLVCKHSSVQPASVTKSAYTVMSVKFEAALQQEINTVLNKCEEDKDVDVLDVLNRLLKISEKSRSLFVGINDPNGLYQPSQAKEEVAA